MPTRFDEDGRKVNEDGGRVAQVVVHQARESGVMRNAWNVPLEGSVAALAPVTPILREGIDLDPPMVGLPPEPGRKSHDDDEEG